MVFATYQRMKAKGKSWAGKSLKDNVICAVHQLPLIFVDENSKNVPSKRSSTLVVHISIEIYVYANHVISLYLIKEYDYCIILLEMTQKILYKFIVLKIDRKIHVMRNLFNGLTRITKILQMNN